MTGDFDELLDLVGGFGRFQLRLFLLMQPPFVFLAFSYFSQIWLVLEPDHWCRRPELERRGWSPEAIRNISAPADRSSCHMFDVDFSTVDPDTWTPGEDTPVVGCRHGWQYDFSEIYPTIVSDQDWVCEDAWKPTLASTLYFAGSVVGTVVFSHVADRRGRLLALVLANLTGCVAGFASAFATSLPAFAALRFVYGISYNALCTHAVTLMTEFVGPRYRSMVVNLPLATSLCFTMVGMPWLAKLLYHWQYTAMATSLPMAFAPLYYFLRVPESCRWLQHTGQVDRAVEEMREIARENGRQVPEAVWAEFTAAAQLRHDQEEREKMPSVLDALRLPRLRRRLLGLTLGTMAVALQFDLIVRTTELDVDVYTGQSVLGVTELPADLLSWLLVETLGRRWSLSGSLLTTSGLAVVLSALLRQGQLPTASMSVAFLVRSGATVALNVLWQLNMELPPTVVRGRVSGAAHVAGHLACMFSPGILQLARVDRGLPSLVLAGVALLGAAIFSTMPETMGRRLPDTLEEGERFGSDQRFWQCFWQNPCPGRPPAKEDEAAGRDNLGCDNLGWSAEPERAVLPDKGGREESSTRRHL